MSSSSSSTTTTLPVRPVVTAVVTSTTETSFGVDWTVVPETAPEQELKVSFLMQQADSAGNWTAPWTVVDLPAYSRTHVALPVRPGTSFKVRIRVKTTVFGDVESNEVTATTLSTIPFCNAVDPATGVKFFDPAKPTQNASIVGDLLQSKNLPGWISVLSSAVVTVVLIAIFRTLDRSNGWGGGSKLTMVLLLASIAWLVASCVAVSGVATGDSGSSSGGSSATTGLVHPCIDEITYDVIGKD